MSLIPRTPVSSDRLNIVDRGDLFATIGGLLHFSQKGYDIVFAIRFVSFDMLWVAFEDSFTDRRPLFERDLLLELIPRIMHVQVETFGVRMTVCQRASKDKVVSEVHKPHINE